MRILKPLPFVALLLASATILAQDHLSFQPQQPRRGDKVTFTYDPKGTILEGEKNIGVLAYSFDKKGPRVHELTLTQEGDKYKGSFEPGNSATAGAFIFVAGEKKDNNNKKGYVFQVYDENGQPVEGANRAFFQIYGGSASYLLEVERQPELSLTYIEKEYRDYPKNRAENFMDYLFALRRVKKDDANDLILEELGKIETAEGLTEENYAVISNLYKNLKSKDKAEAVTAKMKQVYPNGNWKKNEMFKAMEGEKDAAKREAMMNDYIKEFSPENTANIKWMVAQGYAAEKNWQKFNEVLKDVNVKSIAAQYNNTAWAWAEKDLNLDIAKNISWLATDFAKKEMDHPSGEKPPAITDKAWKQQRRQTYAMYADTYSYILYKQKDYKNGYAYSKEAVDILGRNDAEYNDRYALLLEKVAPANQVKKELEELVKGGHAGQDARTALERAYTKVNGSDKGLQGYMAALDAANVEKLKETLQKKMLAKNAPLFRLVNMQGDEVNIASLKGKVVVIDFWATWCGPCKASFPAMQRMVEKYKSNSDVVFLFIDTWENVPDREKLVKDFIAKNKYTFNVLFDKSKSAEAGTNDFVVVKDYEVEGIPTKFVVDGNGQIRFKSIGWSGNEFAFITELSMMIEMAGGASGTGESGKKGF